MEKTEEKQPLRNDELQSGADGDLAYGEDARMFGEGGQTTERAFDPGHNDKPDRDPERDESLPPDEHPDRSKR